MLNPKIQHLQGQSEPWALGNSTDKHSPGLPFSPSPVHTQHEPCRACRRAQEHCRGAQQVWHLLKRELKKKQKYLKSQRKTSSNSRHSCCRINEVSIIIFSRTHTLQVLVQNKRFSIISYSSGKLFPTQQPIPVSCSISQLNIDSHLFHTSQSWSCTEIEYQRCSIPGQRMQELPQNSNPGKVLIVSNSSELGSNKTWQDSSCGTTSNLWYTEKVT